MQFLRIAGRFFLSTIIRLIPATLVSLVILLAADCGGILLKERGHVKWIASWVAIWVAIDFYCRTKNYQEGE
jgi:hypothetical protein